MLNKLSGNIKEVLDFKNRLKNLSPYEGSRYKARFKKFAERDYFVAESDVDVTKHKNDLLLNYPVLEVPSYSLVFYNGIFREDLSDFSDIEHRMITYIKDNTVFVDIKEGVEFDKPLSLIFFYMKEEDKNFNVYSKSNVSLKIGKGSKVDVLEEHISLESDFDDFTNVLHNNLSFRLEDNASVDHYKYWNVAQNIANMNSSSIDLDKGAEYNSLLIQFSAGFVDNQINVNLKSENTKNFLTGVYKVGEKSTYFNSLFQNHVADNSISDSYVKGVLVEEGFMDFKIISGAKEKLKGIALNQVHKCLKFSNESELIARPDMKIYSQDVEGDHGFSVSNINAGDLNYLKSRGIDDKTAEDIIKNSFLNEIINRIKNEDIKKEIEKLIF